MNKIMHMRIAVAVMLALIAAGCNQLERAQQIRADVQADELKDSRTTGQYVSDSTLVFEPDHVDMGTVKEGAQAVGYLRVRNSGSAIANIESVETSCGCTVAEPEQRLLMPGGFTRIRVEVDTFAKQGDARKWVMLTDGEGHHTRAQLTLHVLPDAHLDVVSRSIFKGKCAACHYDPAMGKTDGKRIYGAVCAMCHGQDRAGVSGPSLKGYHDETVLQSLISEGTGSHHMPGFARKNGGPLTRSQIQSLSRWLAKLDE